MVLEKNFSAAIEAHVGYIARLSDRIRNGTAQNLDVARIRRNDLCSFGKWLKTLEPDYGHLPEFKSLLALHDGFHEGVADILALHTDEHYLGTLQKLNQMSDIGGVSGQMMDACLELLLRLEQLGAPPERLKAPLPDDPELSFPKDS